VASDTSVRPAIAIALYMAKWTIKVVDIEAVFLEGALEEPVYIEWPEGMLELGFMTEEQASTTVAQPLKLMYGNVNVALRFFKEYVEHMLSKEMGIYQHLVDPYVFVKKHEGKLVLVALTHVDASQLCGEKGWIEWFKKNIKKRFNYTDMGKLKKHLKIWYKWTTDEHGNIIVIATMPKMVEEIINAYDKHTGKDVKAYTTPGAPGIVLEKNMNTESIELDS
jgi:hypothetical protein